MFTDYDVIVYMRQISLDVTMPQEHAWDFMEEFSRAFATVDFEGLVKNKAVDNYTGHYNDNPSRWHIKLTIWEMDEDRFYGFLRGFCKDKNISFQEPQLS